MSTTPEVPLPPAYEAFAARYKADPADPACADQIATYTDGWDDSTARSAVDNAALLRRIAELEAGLLRLCKSFPTDADMEAAGWECPEVNEGCNAYDAARALLAPDASSPAPGQSDPHPQGAGND